MDWYYYDISGQKQGPIDSSELKRLVTIGTITAETEIETEDGKKSVAGKVKGLKFSNTPISPNPEENNPTTPTPEDNTYNLNDLYSVASDNTVPVPPLTAPSQENQSTNYSFPSSTSYSSSQSTTQSTRRVQQSEEKSSIWDYIFLNPKFTVFVTSTLISLLWRLSVIIFVVSILVSVFMIGNGCRILATIPNTRHLERQKENPPKEIKDLITKKPNLLKEKEKIEKQPKNSPEAGKKKDWETQKENLLKEKKEVEDKELKLFQEMNNLEKQQKELDKENDQITKTIGQLITQDMTKNQKEIDRLGAKRKAAKDQNNSIERQLKDMYRQQVQPMEQQRKDISVRIEKIDTLIEDTDNQINDDINSQIKSIDRQIEDIDDQIDAFNDRIDREISEQEKSNAISKIIAKTAIFEGFGLLIIAPFWLLLIRLSFELIFVFFRIENHLKLIEEKT